MYVLVKSMVLHSAHILKDSYSAECHEGIHGHRYEVEFTIGSEALDKYGMVIDAGWFQKAVCDKIKIVYDHALFYPAVNNNDVDGEYMNMIDAYNYRVRSMEWCTSENIAQILYDAAGDMLKSYDAEKADKGLPLKSLCSVAVRETGSTQVVYVAEDVVTFWGNYEINKF